MALGFTTTCPSNRSWSENPCHRKWREREGRRVGEGRVGRERGGGREMALGLTTT